VGRWANLLYLLNWWPVANCSCCLCLGWIKKKLILTNRLAYLKVGATSTLLMCMSIYGSKLFMYRILDLIDTCSITLYFLTLVGVWARESALKADASLTRDPHFNFSHSNFQINFCSLKPFFFYFSPFLPNSTNLSNATVILLSALGPSSWIDGQLEW